MPQYSNNPQINKFYTEYISSKLEFGSFLIALTAESYLSLASRNYFLHPCEEFTRMAKELEQYGNPRVHLFIKKRINKFDIPTIKELIEFTIEKAGEAYYNYASQSGEAFYIGRLTDMGNKITQVVYHILDIKENDSVCDLECGDGVTLLNLCNLAKKDGIHLSKICGAEVGHSYADITRLLCTILYDGESEVDIQNVDISQGYEGTYTKGYVFPPYSGRYLMSLRDNNSVLYPSIRFASSREAQWIFVDQLLAGLSGDSPRAVALLFGKSLMFADKNSYLQRLIKDGWVESITALPQGMVPGTAVQAFLVAFSRGNSKVTFVDANPEKSYGKVSGFNLGHGSQAYDANEIIRAYDAAMAGESGDNISKNIEELDKVYYSLTPRSVLAQSNSISGDKGISLSSVAQILTGCQYTISGFNVTREKTGYRILTSSDINDGIIDWDNLKNVANDKNLRQDVYLHKNDVIITTKSTIVKVVVADIEPADHVIVTGGMIIVRPDPDKLNPTYLKMYLDSEEGVNGLKAIQTGSVITHISPRALEDFCIPDASIDVQNIKARKYNEMLVHLVSYKNDIKHLEETLKNIINDDEEL